MEKERIKSLFKSFNSKKVLIIGDAMIDAYMWGEINRYSPEAPVPVVEIKKHENRLGGAANVARNIKSLDGEAILCSVIGNDNQGRLFKELMKKEIDKEFREIFSNLNIYSATRSHDWDKTGKSKQIQTKL